MDDPGQHAARAQHVALGGNVAVCVSLVAAVADNGVIGRAGGLPWHLPDDLQHFKAVTLGKTVLMGRRTFESIGRALPGRRNLVMSRGATARAGSAASGSGDTSSPVAAGVALVRSVEEARALVQAAGAHGAAAAPELCVIGGAQVYAAVLPLATRIYLTQVHAVVEGDTYFPIGAPGQRLDLRGWREVERMEHAADERHFCALSFVRLER